MELILQPLRRYADFSGRARRAEYWLFTLAATAIAMVIAEADYSAMQSGGELAKLIDITLVAAFLLFWLGLVTPMLALTFRRLHDTDRSAWWLLIGLIPLAGSIAMLVFTLSSGTPGPNRYGPDPKQ